MGSAVEAAEGSYLEVERVLKRGRKVWIPPIELMTSFALLSTHA